MQTLDSMYMWICINVKSELYTMYIVILTCIPEHRLVSVWRRLSPSSAAQLPVARSNTHSSTAEWLCPAHVIYSGVLQCCPIIKHHNNKINWDMRPEIRKMRWDFILIYFTLLFILPSDSLLLSHLTPHTSRAVHVLDASILQYFFVGFLT